jgi:hypothetical protein
MTLANLILWIALLINLSLLLTIVFNKQQRHKKQVFLLVSLITLWEIIELLNVFWLRNTDYLLLGARFGLLPNLFIAPAFLWLVFSLCESCHLVKKWIKIAVWSPAVLMLPFLFTNYNISSVTVTETGFVFQQEILYWFFLVYFLGILSWALIFLIRTSKNLNLIIKKQVAYIFFGTAITASMGIVFSVILPLFDIKSLFYLGVDSSVFFTITLVYALSHERFLDLRLFFYQKLLDLVALFIVLLIYYFIFWLLLNFINIDFTQFTEQILFVVFVGLSSPWLYQALYRLLDILFFNPDQNFNQTVENVADILRSNRDLNILFSKLAKELAEVIGYEEIFIYLAKHNNSEIFHQVFPVGERLLHLKDDQLLQFLASHSQMVYQAEVEYQNTDHYLSSALKKQQIDLALPIFYNQQLLGVLVIDNGHKLLSKQQLQFMADINKYLDIAVGSLLLANK